MIKMMASVARRPGMTRAEFHAYIQFVHGRITCDNPVTLARYVQNHAFDGAFGTGAEAAHNQVLARDSVTELYWDSAEDMKATFADEYVRTKVGPDGRNFCDESTSASLVASEVELPVVQPREGTGAKVIHYLRTAEGLSLETFFERWSAAHAQVLDIAPLAAASVRRFVQSRQIPDFNPMLAYFGSKEAPYEGAASLWYDTTDSVGLFREYEHALLAINAQPECAFYQPERSFFVYAREVPIHAR